MTIGAGLIEGVSTDQQIGIRPGDLAYEDHNGAVFHEQNENGNGNVAHYEIQDQTDTIDIDLGNYTFPMDRPLLELHTAWGGTEYGLSDRETDYLIVSEQSGFGSDVWAIDVSASGGKLRISDFDPSGSVDGTQAAWLPFITVYDIVD